MADTFVVEKRKADGSLDFSEPQPPFQEATEQQIFDHYFKHHPCNCGKPMGTCRCTASQGEVREWYRAQGFMVRAKTW